ncbi:hypothetical protein ANT_00460 [Anaerolinea thermophila UNI-1]|uniref:Uncharacterized protein n=1 Tax=Anaerolinea thermophila (strain DSM 14523 / JCM 11388 / NBRC 100420 / UNI-1) TaxID=926569 RepID=E8MYD5_ANATU|nr:hypothetical protein ANT_00460 [Anaerolinea thermophila UNI-1]
MGEWLAFIGLGLSSFPSGLSEFYPTSGAQAQKNSRRGRLKGKFLLE